MTDVIKGWEARAYQRGQLRLAQLDTLDLYRVHFTSARGDCALDFSCTLEEAFRVRDAHLPTARGVRILIRPYGPIQPNEAATARKLDREAYQYELAAQRAEANERNHAHAAERYSANHAAGVPGYEQPPMDGDYND